MLRTTLRQSRATVGRLAAAGVAVVLGTAFVAAVLLGGELIRRTALDAVSVEYAGADVVATSSGDPLDDAALTDLRAVPGIAGAEGRAEAGVTLQAHGRSEFGWVGSSPQLAQLRPSAGVVDGELPSGPGGVALDAAVAGRLGLDVGDDVVVAYRVLDPAADPDDPDVAFLDLTQTVRVDALTRAPTATFGGPTVLADATDLATWQGSADGTSFQRVIAVAAAGTSPEAARDAVAQALPDDVTVLTADEQAGLAVDELTGGTNTAVTAVLAFAALALFVAGVVITNTFAVLVAQRTRQLALLRCVGATAGQVRRGVLLEAVALGLVASVVGVAVGTGLAAAAAAALSGWRPDVPVPSTISPTLASVVVPVALGVLVTVLAALAPARAATRVSPLAALRPAEAPSTRLRVSWLRTTTAVVLGAGGVALLVAGIAWAQSGRSQLGVGVAVVGGALSFVGLLVGSVLVVPRLVGLAGRLAALPGGAPARLTAANVVRNPRRTATTTSALLIGVTLVTLMTVGAATTEATLSDRLDEQYPVEVSVGPPVQFPSPVESFDDVVPDDAASVPDPVLGQQVSVVNGVDDVVPVRTSPVGATLGGVSIRVVARAVDPAAARGVVLAPVVVDPLRDGVVLVPGGLAEDWDVASGDTVPLTLAGRTVRLRAEVTALPGYDLLLTPADLDAVAPDAPVTTWWLGLTPGADAAAVVADVRDAVTGAPTTAVVDVDGAAVERAAYASIIDTLLLVVIGLLGVAVVIALIGVANTLSLSVIERTRESAVLRALGLTRGQLRGMLALEGALVAGVGALLGLLLGTVYGWSGAAAVLADSGGTNVALSVPRERLGLVLAVAVVAGLLASVLPARRAARTPPVAALAE